MCKTKKLLILIPVIAVVLLFGITAGIAFAQSGSDRPDPDKDILARVAQILGIDQKKLVDAFNQAHAEFEKQMLAQLVKDGKITQQQADQLKAWEANKPKDADPNSQAFQDWLKSRPNVPLPQPPGPPFPPPSCNSQTSAVEATK